MFAREYVQKHLWDAVHELDLEWPEKASIEPPREKSFGDLACNLAMLLAGQTGEKPRDLAARLKDLLQERAEQLQGIEIAGPGFLNFSFKPSFWQSIIPVIQNEQDTFGSSDLGRKKRVQIEYVSANPTGPLHIGHGRGAALGDSLARIMRFAGFEASTEYYLNDAGRQMHVLGESVLIRYEQLCGLATELSQEHYQGEYLQEDARKLFARHGKTLLDQDRDIAIALCREQAVQSILAGIKDDLEHFGVEHQVWFSEQDLYDRGEVQKTLQWLQKRDLAYIHDGALWFRSTSLGDDKDRVLQKSDGTLTYFASDIAYHHNKFNRGFETVVDIWGADHHGYVPRMQAAIQALGRPARSLRVILVQLVNLLRAGQQVSMSTRSGEFVPLRQVMEEVGVDACRFIFLSRKSDSHLDFDLEEVKKKSMDNPVFYVQYAHARICSVFAKAAERGIGIDPDPQILLHLLDSQEDLELLKQLEMFPDMVQAAARNLSPHHISFYLRELAGLLHRYYTVHSVLNADSRELIQARMLLLQTTATVIRNGLRLLGVHAPEKM
ncbi:arginine--tRNA ligase [Desulfonatronospira sp.]|uniref:arginine--tRNA ligase n=1 Tax=Desulfonatronospira sp. TaxID=1962951 RepID=UPI0025C4F6C8|nr:arginine--tRNA ligase [Desulfonatronospira sp.]